MKDTQKRGMGHSAIISGGMGGIGQAAAMRLAHDGHKILVLYHQTDKHVADAFIGTLPGKGHYAASCDLVDRASVEDVIGDAQMKLGDIGICIHAATGPIIRKRASVMNIDEFRSEFEVSVFGGFNLFRAVIPRMKLAGGGRIIGLTTAALDSAGQTNMAGYLVAKHALRGLLRELAKEMAPIIAVNAVAPAFVSTELHGGLPGPVRDFIRERTPSHRPEEVAAVISYLCSEVTLSVTGMSFPVGPSEPVRL